MRLVTSISASSHYKMKNSCSRHGARLFFWMSPHFFFARCNLQSAESAAAGSIRPDRVIDRVRCCNLSAARRKTVQEKKKETLCNMFEMNLNGCEIAQEAEGGSFRRGSDEWPALEMEKECRGRCLFICSRTNQWRLFTHGKTWSTCVAAFIIAAFNDVCANLPGLHKISDIHLNPHKSWSFIWTKSNMNVLKMPCTSSDVLSQWCRYSC